MRRSFDLDLDVKSNTEKDKYGVRAMVYNDETERILPHPSGYYLETVPVDLLTGCCSFDYEYGEEKGFLKVDLLTNTTYDGFISKEEVITALNQDPDWDLFLDEEIVATLPHIAKHFDIVRKVKPRSIQELADILALIRPGKSHLIDSYLKNRERIRDSLYKRSANGQAYFKKSHAISYASMIVCYLNQSQGKSRIVW